MTSPATPAEALKRATDRITAQREAAQKVSAEIAEGRASEAARTPENTPERAS